MCIKAVTALDNGGRGCLFTFQCPVRLAKWPTRGHVHFPGQSGGTWWWVVCAREKHANPGREGWGVGVVGWDVPREGERGLPGSTPLTGGAPFPSWFSLTRCNFPLLPPSSPIPATFSRFAQFASLAVHRGNTELSELILSTLSLAIPLRHEERARARF